MTFTPEAVDSLTVQLIPGLLIYTGSKELDQYNIINYTISADTISEEQIIGIKKSNTTNVVNVKITFGRGLLSIMLTIFFTTFLMSLVGHTSVFYKDQYFESQVSLNVTIMLVQVTVFTAVS